MKKERDGMRGNDSGYEQCIDVIHEFIDDQYRDHDLNHHHFNEKSKEKCLYYS